MGTAAMTGPRAKGIRGPQASAAAGRAAGRAPEPAAGTGHRHLVFRLGICSLTEPGPSGWGRGEGLSPAVCIQNLFLQLKYGRITWTGDHRAAAGH